MPSGGAPAPRIGLPLCPPGIHPGWGAAFSATCSGIPRYTAELGVAAPFCSLAGVVASDVVRRRYHEVVGTSEGAKEHAEELLGSVQRPLEGDCPICFEELSPEGRPGEPVVFCHTCGNNIHRDCFARWSQSKPKGQVCARRRSSRMQRPLRPRFQRKVAF